MLLLSVGVVSREDVTGTDVLDEYSRYQPACGAGCSVPGRRVDLAFSGARGAGERGAGRCVSASRRRAAPTPAALSPRDRHPASPRSGLLPMPSERGEGGRTGDACRSSPPCVLLPARKCYLATSTRSLEGTPTTPAPIHASPSAPDPVVDAIHNFIDGGAHRRRFLSDSGSLVTILAIAPMNPSGGRRLAIPATAIPPPVFTYPAVRFTTGPRACAWGRALATRSPLLISLRAASTHLHRSRRSHPRLTPSRAPGLGPPCVAQVLVIDSCTLTRPALIRDLEAIRPSFRCLSPTG